MFNIEKIIKKENKNKVQKSVLFTKVRFSILKNIEVLKFESLHSQKYYQKIVNQPLESSKQISKNIIKESTKKVEAQQTKKSKWVSIIFMLINLGIVIGIILWNFLGNPDAMSFDALLKQGINWLWVLIGVGVFLLINFLDGGRIFVMLLYATKRCRPFLSYKSVAMCRYYDCLTPLATGGQPFQIFYLSKRGVPAGTATSVPIAKYLYSQTFTVLFIAIVLILQRSYIISLDPAILTLCYIGFALSVLVICSILFLSISKKFAPSCAIGVLKLLSKMHIVKDYRKSFVKVMKTVREYVVTMKQFISNKWIAIAMLILSVAVMFAMYTIPYVVYRVFVDVPTGCLTGMSWAEVYWSLFTIGIVCDLACCFIPSPGATGVAEISFAFVFSRCFGGDVAVWALLLWRVFTYYGYLLQGISVMGYDALIGNKKIKPLLEKFKKEDLEKEAKKQNTIKVIKK